MLKKILLFIAINLALLIIILIVNTLRHESRQLNVPPVEPVAIDANAAAERLAGGIRFRTISKFGEPDANMGEFAKLRAHLA